MSKKPSKPAKEVVKLKSIPKKDKKENNKKLKVSTKEKLQKSFEKKKKNFKKKVKSFKEKSKEFFFGKEVYIKGQEPPKYYSFEKKFYGFYIIFLTVSFILLFLIGNPDNPLLLILTLGNPFAFGNTIIAIFLTLSVLFSFDQFRIFIFEQKTHIKQLILIIGLFISYFFLFTQVLTTDFNFITYLLSLAMVWLALLSSKFYTAARKISTKIESRFIERYSPFRYFVALITPFIIIGFLFIVVLFYRTILVFLALDFFAPNDPAGGVKVYYIEMRYVMPLIYFSLILALLFIIFEFIFTRSKAETKRAGCFDNFTFAMVVFFIFFFQLFQITIYLINRPETQKALRNTVGATSTTVTWIFFAEFAVSMYFLYRILSRLGGSFGWRFLFWKKDGLILFFLACVLAQTLIRFTLSSNIEGQEIAGIGLILSADRFIVSVLMILFLGFTLLIYYLKPHETSMFMRMQKETINEEDKAMERIYKILKKEYIRRGEPYPLHIMEKDLIYATNLSKGLVYSLIHRLAEREMDVVIENKGVKDGKVQKFIDFMSITERFEKKDVARKKAQKYLSERLVETTSAEKRKTMKLTKDKLDESKASHQFIGALTSDYSKKRKDEEKIKQKQSSLTKTLTFKTDVFTGTIHDRIIELLKKEYLYRIENEDDYPEYRIPISEIAGKIQSNTKVNPGELYPMLNEISKRDLELNLIPNPKEPDDKMIEFFPIADDAISASLSNFRPDDYEVYQIEVIKKFNAALSKKKVNTVIANLKRTIKNQNEMQKAWTQILTILYNYFPTFQKELKYVPNRMKVINLLEEIIKTKEKKKK
ncbi:MAG: hypothetical protein ACTSR8_16735 [Promethearchaeota archaeon]